MAVGPPLMKTVLTSKPSAAKKPKSTPTINGQSTVQGGSLIGEGDGFGFDARDPARSYDCQGK